VQWSDVVQAVYLGSPVQTLTIAATDDVYPGVTGSGLDASGTDVTEDLPTGAVGTFPLTFEARDNLGHTSTKTCSYEVVYKFSGFYTPIDNEALNSSSAGQGVAVKWRITNYAGTPILDSNTFIEVTTSPAKTTANCNVADFAVGDESFKGGSNLQNLGAGNYQFNWATLKAYANSCRTMTLRLVGPGLTRHPPGAPATWLESRRYQFANFQFKK
jgi:hypothetical protein